MSYIVAGKIAGRDNRGIAGAAFRENMTPGVEYAPRNPEATYCGPVNSTTYAGSGTTATGTATGHGYAIGDVIVTNGAAEAGYNGQHRILTVADADTFTHLWYGSTSPATGTITSKKILANLGD